jgi:hypothetical protein
VNLWWKTIGSYTMNLRINSNWGITRQLKIDLYINRFGVLVSVKFFVIPFGMINKKSLNYKILLNSDMEKEHYLKLAAPRQIQ